MKFRIILLSLLVFAFLLVFSQNSYACNCELQLSKGSLKKQVKDAKKKSQSVFYRKSVGDN